MYIKYINMYINFNKVHVGVVEVSDVELSFIYCLWELSASRKHRVDIDSRFSPFLSKVCLPWSIMFERNNNSVQIGIANYTVVHVCHFVYYQRALVHSSGCYGSTSGNQGQRGYDAIDGDKTEIKKRDVSSN